MNANPSEAAVQAWARLVRVSGTLLDAVEAELKAAGFPALAWYDALLELGRAPGGRLRPFELERHMLLPQYSTSRLIDRLEKAGLVSRLGCPNDGRGQHVTITEAGRELRVRMWPAYAAAIERHIGSKIGCTDAQKLAELLGRLSSAGCGSALGEASPIPHAEVPPRSSGLEARTEPGRGVGTVRPSRLSPLGFAPQDEES